MNQGALIHPPGGLPDSAPKGLVDVWMPNTPSAALQAKALLSHAFEHHALGIVFWGLLLCVLIGLAIWFWRDWRGRLLRWQIRRLQHLLRRHPDQAPEPVGAALTWALSRYFQPGNFKARSALNRSALRPDWRALVLRLDILRFGPKAAHEDWFALLRAMQECSRRNATAAAAPQVNRVKPS
ncbi:MAG: hypothetical protein B7X44_09695 [Halothiobacillus sp. 15-55-196]|jgi:hypothetical protein|uniref:hypothetical protein n=1 Tax=Halothiobacillus sp. 15-55-196 TaxID=1970382 RepID=UPI000BC4E2A4|nr:hypothetical protein [Halothiobacillus sp. 15-55-196]OZB35512.1 MAG: hypothetical protein B7X44_09695 [Halothiobacillus sp. 15-55-196]